MAGSAGYNSFMATGDLTSARNLFSVPHGKPFAFEPDWAGREFQEAAKRYISQFSEQIKHRKIGAIEQKRALNISFQHLSEKGAKSLAQGLMQLAETIAQFEILIEQGKASLLQQQAELDAALASVASVSASDAKLARRSVNEFIELGGVFHNETVEFYYFLLALQSEYTPDARGGPSFDDPGMLGAYLRDQLKV